MTRSRYLTEVAADSGALRVVPGSHHAALSDAMHKVPLSERNAWEGVGDDDGLAVDEVPCYVLDSRPGDVVLFDFRIWHGSWRGGKDRRMFSLQYFKDPVFDSDVAAMRQHVAGAVAQRREIAAKGHQTSNKDGVFGIMRGYPQYWLDNKPQNVYRAHWIKWLQDWGLVGGSPRAPTTI
jgi:ectoine hydroxylase-related dioxygenase (phytanoyl-CoA dioxygenase family)